MAHIYHRGTIETEDKHALIRAINEEDYHVAVTFNSDNDEEDNITEVLLTKAEVQECYDILFNR